MTTVTRPHRLALVLACVLGLTLAIHAEPLGTAFIYQGQLTSDTVAANGDYDFKFVLYGALERGAGLATNIIRPLGVSNGVFTATLDFGADAFDGTARWLEISVRPYSGVLRQPAYTVLAPRQSLMPLPYALDADVLDGHHASEFVLKAGDALTGDVKLDASLTVAGPNSKVTLTAIQGSGAVSPPDNLGIYGISFAQNGSGMVGRADWGTQAQAVTGKSEDGVGGRFDGGTYGIYASSGPGYAGQFTGNVRVNADYATAPAKPQLELGDANANGVSRLRLRLGKDFWDIANRTDTGGNALRFYSSAAGKELFALSTNGSMTAGGEINWIAPGSPQSAIGGGQDNRIGIGSGHSVIAGGHGNAVESTVASLGGGYRNTNQSPASTIGGGWQNQIATNANNSTIAGGAFNRVQPYVYGAAWNGAIGGGQNNTVEDEGGTVPGGTGNRAGKYAFAAGREAWALHEGSFVWSDGTEQISDGIDHLFVINASNGVVLHGDTDLLMGSGRARNGLGQRINLPNGAGIGVQPGVLYFRASAALEENNGFAWYVGGLHTDGAYEPGEGRRIMRLRYLTNLEDPCPRPYIEKTAWLEVTGAIWAAGPMVGLCFTESSDRNAKENFSPIDPRSVLDRVVALPISEWNYTNTPTRHLGPMAQDFYGAFGVGPDDKHITTLDADGVALAAIQGLNQKLEDQVKAKDARIATLEKDVAELGKARDAQIDALEKDMAELKSAVKRLLEQARDPGAIRSL